MAEGVSFTSVHLWTPQEHLGIPLRGIGASFEECLYTTIGVCVFDIHIFHAVLTKEVVDDAGEVRVNAFFRGIRFHGEPVGGMFAFEKHVQSSRQSEGISAEALALFSVRCCS